MEIKNLKNREKLIEDYKNLSENDKNILDNSYRVVIDTNASASRIKEIKEFCKKMGYKKIGFAFCKGLRKYGEILDEIFGHDFEVYSVCCNVGDLKRDEINVPKLTESSDELACNPIGEAECLNEKEVDFVIMVGFCLGHEQLFSKNINAPTTTLLVKDRKYKHKTIKEFENN
ncbi:MAG: DUF1847 domain-containing protein [Candidatus Pacearchaeota archaeon]|nr:DUF1847 domain-containing protein [Candidatus Pacearchaeota archaeon]